MTYTLEVTLLSDTTFASGDGLAGYVDTEVEYDHQLGVPIIRGRTLKGLLTEECANILSVLGNPSRLTVAAKTLFGTPGESADHAGILRIGNAYPTGVDVEELRRVVRTAQQTAEVLSWFTTVRSQTSIGDNGAPEKGSLRSSRVVVRETVFSAPVELLGGHNREALLLLVACARGIKRGGQSRNRGRGRLNVMLKGANVPTLDDFALWVKQEVQR
jgi:hypothetical protein